VHAAETASARVAILGVSLNGLPPAANQPS